MKACFKLILGCMFFTALSCGIVFAQEDYDGYEGFLKVEAESEADAERDIHDDQLRNMRAQLNELEYYKSELKAQEAKALASIPAAIKNKKFKTAAEKAAYYKKLSAEYTDKLANENLSEKDIKISQNLITLFELYSTEETIKNIKKEIEKRKK